MHRPCRGCPERQRCAEHHFAGRPLICAEVKAAVPPTEKAMPADPPMELHEAAGVLVRHWDAFGTKGIEAAVTLVRRVLDRIGKPA